MTNFTGFLIWVLTAYGITNVLSESKILAPYRNKLKGKLLEMVKCYMCLGFWVGMALGWFWRSPTDIIILDGFLGSSVCWLLSLPESGLISLRTLLYDVRCKE